jgi:hypothetical protein
MDREPNSDAKERAPKPLVYVFHVIARNSDGEKRADWDADDDQCRKPNSEEQAVEIYLPPHVSFSTTQTRDQPFDSGRLPFTLRNFDHRIIQVVHAP